MPRWMVRDGFSLLPNLDRCCRLIRAVPVGCEDENRRCAAHVICLLARDLVGFCQTDTAVEMTTLPWWLFDRWIWARFLLPMVAGFDGVQICYSGSAEWATMTIGSTTDSGGHDLLSAGSKGCPDLVRHCRPNVELTPIVGLLERGLLGGLWTDDCCIACSGGPRPIVNRWLLAIIWILGFLLPPMV
ncbi:hypothetical protein ACLOJK_018996 [Asimina triloba]